MNIYTTSDINMLIEMLNQQQVIAYPTEAVFGLGCDPDSQLAVERLLTLKKRPWQKGLILVAADYSQLSHYVDDSQLNTKQKDRIFASWPGPVTWVMPIQPEVPYWLTGKFHSLAVRVSASNGVKALCSAFGRPLVSTSANLTGMPACKTFGQVIQQFGHKFPVLNGDVDGRNNPSEIRDALTGNLLRQG